MSHPGLSRSTHPAPARPIRVLQFGEGNFLRAFVDWMIHEMNQQTDFDAGVQIVQPIDRGLVDMLNEQDGLYTVCLTGLKDGQAVQEKILVDCIQGGVNPYRDFSDYLAFAKKPDLRFIISNTTEAGIAYVPGDSFADAPPSSFPGKLTRFLFERYEYFKGATDKGLVIIPCELIDRNGDQLKAIVLKYAQDWSLDPDFTDWVKNTCTFCNTLVDRIVPGYPKDRVEELYQELGYTDRLITEGERFHLWVIEGPKSVEKEFPSAEAGLNVVFTDDMTPYRQRKVRILNGAHTSMVPVGYLYGLRTVREAVEHPVVGPFVESLIFEEIIPTLDLPEAELKQFAADVLDRFRNPYIKHFLHSISLNSTSKYATRVLPSLLTYVERKNALPKRLVLGLAATVRFFRGTDLQGEPIELKDDADRVDFLRKLWTEHAGDYTAIAREVLARTDFWKQDLNTVPGLTHLLAEYLEEIDQKGMDSAIQKTMAT